MQRMKKLIACIGRNIRCFVFKMSAMKKVQPHFVVAADGALEKFWQQVFHAIVEWEILTQSQKMYFVILRRIKIQSYSPFHLKRMRQMQSLLCSLQ